MQFQDFVLLREEQVEELNSLARLWRHEDTGATVLSFSNSDENKVFGVSFRTPAPCSTGVAHILEHSVLCGSEKYPVKEPFVELLKGSLQTFLNAFTYPDKTCYPVASTNLADFRNLMDVYLDAVFFPRIDEKIFRQEGWRLDPVDEMNAASVPFLFQGVVYNEMKGAMSSPESVLDRHCLHSLFPDTIYAFESGGDPAVIPDLSYEEFLNFHQTYYHPSNARFFCWGDDPEQERLERLGETLARFSPLQVESAIGLQKRLNAPRILHVPFAAGKNEKGMTVVNWLGPDVMDMELGLAFRMLEHMLLGMPASPLRRALIESGLGEDIAGNGLEPELRQLVFSVGLRGTATSDAKQMQEIILDTLRRLADGGVPKDVMEAALNTVEFHLRENDTGRFPVGLSVMLRSLTTWLHDGDPLAPLRFESHLQTIKEKIAQGEQYFEKILREWLLDNPHRVLLVLTPDADLGERQEQEESTRLATLVDGMGEEEKKRVLEDAKTLKIWQSTPDTEEALAAIPRLGVKDLPLNNTPVPSERLEPTSPPIFFHPLPTAGITYADVAFDLSAVPEYLLPLLPLFGRALLEMGTEQKDFVALNMTIAQKTGGMDVDTLFLTHATTRTPVARLILSGKAGPEREKELFALMGEVLSECRFDQKERFHRMVLEEKARMEQSLIPSGHQMVATRLRAALAGAGMLAEYTGGVSYLFYLRTLAQRVESDWASALQDLEFLGRSIIHRAGLAFNFTAETVRQGMLQQLAYELGGRLPEQSVDGASTWIRCVADLPRAEALLLPAQVNYIGKGINLFDSGYVWHGSAEVILKHLRTGYLWEKVRVHGGAYGCTCSLDRMSGALHMVSYRDPNIQKTLDAYDRTAQYLARHSFTRKEIDTAIVGAIGELDTYLLPSAKGASAFSHELCGDAEDLRQNLREEMLGTTAKQFAEFGRALEAFANSGRVCALGGRPLERVAKKQGWHRERML